jgi:hypothetical protein
MMMATYVQPQYVAVFTRKINMCIDCDAASFLDIRKRFYLLSQLVFTSSDTHVSKIREIVAVHAVKACRGRRGIAHSFCTSLIDISEWPVSFSCRFTFGIEPQYPLKIVWAPDPT